MSEIPARLNLLRDEMKMHGFDVLIIPTADPHGSEYLAEHDQVRKYLSGFTGSAGTLVVDRAGAVLFTDGRYFIQAERELAGTGIRLMRMRTAGVPTLTEYLCGFQGRIGVDYSLISETQRREIAGQLPGGTVLADCGNLADRQWADRPALPCGGVFFVPPEISGEGRAERLARVRQEMDRAGAGAHLLSVLDEIAWVLNVRGSDIQYTPVVRSYLLIRDTDAVWFVDEGHLTGEQREALARDGISVAPYEACEEEARRLQGMRVLACPGKTSAALWQALSGAEVCEAENPVFLMKCIKNDQELAHLRTCHEKDGAALTRFFFWLRHTEEPLTECTVQEKLLAFRREMPGFLEPSFGTICAFGPNGAMMHYKASPDRDTPIERGFLLIDSGGQYQDGTTDVTRTFAMGELTQGEKEHFTAVLAAVIDLASVRFLEGMTGKGLDILARRPIWRLGLDYRCGTGHGVGFLLCVHEGPNSFRWHESASRGEETVLEPGMVTTDEPGIYLEGRYGIRTENELVCVPIETNEYGRFLGFETITYAPIDLEAVLPDRLTEDQRSWLNDYHREVYARLLPYMQGAEEQDFLRHCTRAI